MTKSHGLLMAQMLIKQGHNTILDDTFTSEYNCRSVFKIDPKAKATWIPNFDTYKCPSNLSLFVKVCQDRAKQLGQDYLVPVIFRTAMQAHELADKYGENLDALRINK